MASINTGMSFELDSCIRGHHIYKDVWTPVVDEGLNCRREEGNISDPYVVAAIKSGSVVGHVPHWISTACNLFHRSLVINSCNFL